MKKSVWEYQVIYYKYNFGDMNSDDDLVKEINYLWIYAKLNSFRADCIIVSLTAQNTSLIFSVSVKNVT